MPAKRIWRPNTIGWPHVVVEREPALALAHSILVIAYYVLKRGVEYEDLGPNYFDERNRTAVVRRSVRRIEQLGYKVTIDAA